MIKVALHKLRSREVAGICLRLGSVGLVVLVNVVFARSLGPDIFGTYTYVMSWLLMLSLLQRSGLAILLVREVSVYLQSRQYNLLSGVIRRAWQFTIVVTALLAALAFVVCELLILSGASTGTRLLYVALPILPLLGLMAQMEAVTRGSGRVVVGQAGEFVVRHAVQLVAFGIVLMVPVPFLINSTGALLSAVIGATMAMMFATVFYRSVCSSHSIEAPAYEDRKWSASLVYLFGSTGVSAINGYLGILLAGIWLEPAEIAVLQIATQITVLVTLGLAVINLVQAADFAEQFARGNMRVIQQLAVQGCQLSLGFGLFVVIGFVFAGPWLINALFGANYSESYVPTLIMMVGQLFNAATGSASTLLNSANLERYALASVVTSSVCMAIMIVPLTSMYGITGSAVAVATGLVVWKGVSIWFLYRETGIINLPFLIKPN